MSFLDLRAVRKTYGATAALDGISLAVPAGSHTAIVGPSGSGKTTLLRLIAGFEAPDAGEVVLDGATLADGAGFVPAHRRGIGIVAQDGALFPHLDIAGNIGFGLPRNDPGRAGTIARLIDMVGLDTAMLGRKPDELSGGQQQRVALARALALRPRLMLLDEPFSALDTGLRASTRKAVTALLRAEGITTLLVTHDQEEALSFADQVAVLDKGRLLQAGTPQELYTRPRNAMIAAFMGEAILLPATSSENWADCALGRIAVAGAHANGAGALMLRPAQIDLATEPDDLPAEPGIGTVVGVDYSGATSTVAVRMPGGPGTAPEDLQFRRPFMDVPKPGDRVRVRVSGTGQFFPAL